MMTKNSTESLIPKPKRTIKPTAKIVSMIEEEEEESSGPEDPQVHSNLPNRIDMSDNDGDGDDDDGDINDDEEESGEGGTEEDENEEVLPVVVPQKRKKVALARRTNKSILICYTIVHLINFYYR